MRYQEIIAETIKPIYYHGSKKEFPIGFVLRPQTDGYVHGVYGDESDAQIRRTEAILERYRPSEMISRFESVFLVAARYSIEHAGGSDTHIYRVQPIGPCQKACLWWYSQIEGEMFDPDNELSEDQAKEWASNYWHAVQPPAGNPTTYEFRCRSAKIVEIIR